MLNQSADTFKLRYYGNYSFGTDNTIKTLSGGETELRSHLQQEKMVGQY